MMREIPTGPCHGDHHQSHGTFIAAIYDAKVTQRTFRKVQLQPAISEDLSTAFSLMCPPNPGLKAKARSQSKRKIFGKKLMNCVEPQDHWHWFRGRHAGLP